MEQLAARYRRFAAEEARGRSPLYEALAIGIAADPDALRFLRALPPAKRQPNLLLAAVRHLHGTAPDWPWFRDRLLADQAAIRAVMLARATQTNEPNRCAVLLPLLARLPQPLALIEIGASAGLCLLPDFYGYDYGTVRLDPAGQGAPVFPCAPDAATPLPAAIPRIAWRAGIDLNPLDATDPEQSAWLETLVWPEQTRRLVRLRAAVRRASAAPRPGRPPRRRAPPPLRRGPARRDAGRLPHRRACLCRRSRRTRRFRCPHARTCPVLGQQRGARRVSRVGPRPIANPRTLPARAQRRPARLDRPARHRHGVDRRSLIGSRQWNTPTSASWRASPATAA